jgi:hypothetical protein
MAWCYGLNKNMSTTDILLQVTYKIRIFKKAINFTSGQELNEMW